MTRFSQPQGPALIDWSHPLARGLISAVIPALGIDSVSGRALTASGTATTIGTGASGRKLIGTGNSVRYAEVTPVVMTNWTAFVHVDGVSTTTNNYYCGVGNASAATPLMGVLSGATDGSKIRLFARNDAGTNTAATVSTSRGVTDGAPHSVATVCTQTAISSYVDGSFDTTTAQVSGTYTATKFAVCANWRSGAMATPIGNNVYVALLFNRALSDAEIKQLSENPWALFQSPARQIWVPDVGGGYTYTLTADQSAYTLSGSDATLTYVGNKTLTAEAASFALNGAAATLAYNRAVTADQATYTLTANPATLAFNRALTADTVGYSLTGSAATLTYSPITGATYTLPAAAGDLTLSASDAALVAARKVIAEAYAAVLAGADATLTYTPLALPTIGRPTSDTANTGWVASTGSDLYAMVDEVTPDSGDYISANAVGKVCSMALNATAYPGTASQVLKYRASSSTGNSVIVRLKEGATTIRSETQALTSVDTEYQITLTSGEIAAITSGSLLVELESA